MSARTAPLGARRRPAPRTGRVTQAHRAVGAGSPVRWDRVGRLAMLCLLVALSYLYLSAGVHMFSTWRQARHDNATVATLKREHAALLRRHVALGKQGTVEAEARQLGMIAPGEQPYVISGLPGN